MAPKYFSTLLDYSCTQIDDVQNMGNRLNFDMSGKTKKKD